MYVVLKIPEKNVHSLHTFRPSNIHYQFVGHYNSTILINNENRKHVSFKKKQMQTEIVFEPANDKIYTRLVCSLIRVFADRMCLLQPQWYPKKDKRESLPY